MNEVPRIGDRVIRFSDGQAFVVADEWTMDQEQGWLLRIDGKPLGISEDVWASRLQFVLSGTDAREKFILE